MFGDLGKGSVLFVGRARRDLGLFLLGTIVLDRARQGVSRDLVK